MITTRTTLDDWVFPADEDQDEPDCGHMVEFVDDEGNCFRCDSPLQRTDEERQAESDLVGGFEPRRLR